MRNAVITKNIRAITIILHYIKKNCGRFFFEKPMLNIGFHRENCCVKSRWNEYTWDFEWGKKYQMYRYVQMNYLFLLFLGFGRRNQQKNIISGKKKFNEALFNLKVT